MVRKLQPSLIMILELAVLLNAIKHYGTAAYIVALLGDDAEDTALRSEDIKLAQRIFPER